MAGSSYRGRGTQPFEGYTPQQQYYDEFNNYQQQQQFQQQLLQLQQQITQQQQQNAAQEIYNANAIAAAQGQQAGTQYGLGNDIASLGLQVTRGKEDLLQAADRGKTDLAQQNLGNQRYLQSLAESVARQRYQRSVSETASPFEMAARLYGY